jgi:hypothetical protein
MVEVMDDRRSVHGEPSSQLVDRSTVGVGGNELLDVGLGQSALHRV